MTEKEKNVMERITEELSSATDRQALNALIFLMGQKAKKEG